MLKRWKRYSAMALVIPFVLGILSMSGLAAGLGIAVSAIGQDGKILEDGYFDITVTPGETLELTVRVTNTVHEDLNLTIMLTDAFTATDGHMDYSVPGIRDEALIHPFSEMAALSQSEVTLAEGESKDLLIKLNVPQEIGDGKIVGGVLVRQEPEEPDSTSAGGEKAGTSIRNIFQYAMPVVIRHNDGGITPDFQIAGIEPKLINQRAGVQVNLRNLQALIISGGTLTAQLYQVGLSEPLFTQKFESFEMAPSSIWELQFVDDAGYGFPAGDYNIKMTVGYKEQNWDFDETFTIDKELADSINENAINQQKAPQRKPDETIKSPIPVKYILVAAAGAAILLLIILLIVRKKRKSREYEQYVMDKAQQMLDDNNKNKIRNKGERRR